MIKRNLVAELRRLATQFPVVSLFGPRQSGKTTLSQMAFEDYKYINLENPSIRKIAQADPMGFLETYFGEKGIILDEVQNIPELLSYIQVYVDEHKRNGFFILTGSQNILLNQSISQSLAGRVAILTLLPLALNELAQADMYPKSFVKAMFEGSYPGVVVEGKSPLDWYPAYIRTYVERDVRMIKNITDLSLFQHFVELCAGRVGQLLNVTSLGNDCGVSDKTIHSWLSVLEASYIIFLLRPYHKNFSKRVVKTPKLYFYDTGLACSLLGIRSEEELMHNSLKGNLFESFIISEFMKAYFNQGRQPKLYFWRDSHGHEVDCVLEKGTTLTAVEIKASKTMNTSFFDGLRYWSDLTKSEPKDNFVVYGGEETYSNKGVTAVGWGALAEVLR